MRLAIGGVCAALLLAVAGCGGKGAESGKPGPSFAGEPSTTPGHLPGEVFARAGDYRRWFPEMAALGVKVIRVYTLLDPSFYSELRRYDLAHPKAPLYGWEPWQRVVWHERRKAGWDTLREAFAESVR